MRLQGRSKAHHPRIFRYDTQLGFVSYPTVGRYSTYFDKLQDTIFLSKAYFCVSQVCVSCLWCRWSWFPSPCQPWPETASGRLKLKLKGASIISFRLLAVINQGFEDVLF